MDYFDILLAKKLSGGGGGEITVEGLSVEENGTYTAPSGKAYSPVVVNLPLGEKAITANGEYNASADDLKGFSKVTVNVEGYKVKSMPAGAVSSFADGTDNPLRDLKVSIVPVQSGSGDPSPSNPRPISGWTGANVHVADGENPHVIDNVVNVSWQTEAGTVYGGELDVTTGVLKSCYERIKAKDLPWSYSSGSGGYFGATITDKLEGITNVKSEVFKTSESSSITYMEDNSIKGGANNKVIYIRCSTAEGDVDNLKTILGESYIIYEISEPNTYQLTPTQIRSILGTNNVWVDTGEITEGEYFASL